jgi:superfamily II RNA helicase
VGVNVPIRAVVFAQLCKFDGEKVGILRVREFKQIAGRAGRKGFDERGYVVCEAPEHVIENKRLAARAAAGKRRQPKKKPPGRGFVPWNRETFEQLLVELVNRSHESERSKARLRRHAAALFRSLRRAGIVQTVVDGETGRRRARVRPELQLDFSLHRNLSLYLVEALSALDPESTSYALEVLSLAEAIQEDPMPILIAQEQKRKRELLARLKAERVPYEERISRLEEVSWPKPEAEYIYRTFLIYSEAHPWVSEENIRPKSIAREMFESCRDFVDYVREHGVARSEGLLLRYLSQLHNTLVQTVPEEAKTEEVYDAIAFLRTTLQNVDSSLVQAWETLLRPEAAGLEGREVAAPPPFDVAHRPKALAARVRAEFHALVRDLAAREFEAAAQRLRQDPEDPWDAARLERALAPFFEEYGEIVFTPQARLAQRTRLEEVGPRRWSVTQVLCDPLGDELWALHGEVDLKGQRDPEGPLVCLRRIGQ